MNNKSFFKSFLVVVASIALFASCDKDFNQIGSDIIDDGHYGFLKYTDASLVAFNQGVGVVQTNNLPINSLGIYDNPVFGKTKANFVTQLQMATPNPTFDPTLIVHNGSSAGPVLDSVVLNVPYFSHIDVAGVPNTYKLDSISGNTTINLKVYENGYYLSDLDPTTNAQEFQKYYNNQDGLFDGNKGSIILNDSVGSNTNDLIKYAENQKFIPNNKEYITYNRDDYLIMKKTTENVASRTSPRMSLHLNKFFFENKILNAPSGKLFNNTTFKNYFRGLYFQVEDANNGNLTKLDFSKGTITLYYKEYYGLVDNDNNSSTPNVPIKIIKDGVSIDRYSLKSFVLNMSGNTVNLLDQTNKSDYLNALAMANPTNGDSKLFVKGGAESSIALIDLFGKDLHGDDGLTGSPNGIADELDEIRNKKWLINDASLTFNIDNSAMQSAPEPQRVYLYDVRNHRPVYDYATDGTTNANAKFNKSIHGGFIEREQISGGRGIKYKVRITNYLRNLVNNKDSTNVRLGLVVTESIGITANSRLKQTVNVPFPIPSATNKALDRFPASAVMYQLGTILYGNNIPFGDPNYDKRLKLEIYYTKPN
jgi:hypothetical protein